MNAIDLQACRFQEEVYQQNQNVNHPQILSAQLNDSAKINLRLS